MQYISTRNNSYTCTDLEALVTAFAPDGGLIVPAYFPKLSLEVFANLRHLSFAERAAKIVHLFVPSLDYKKLSLAFSNLKSPSLVRANPYGELSYFYECFNGETGSIKDISQEFAASILPLVFADKEAGHKSLILNVSSGSNACAMQAAFKNKDSFLPLCIFPKQKINKLYFTNLSYHKTQNSINILVDESFEKCQNYLETLFNRTKLSDELSKKNMSLISTQSFTWLSILPQIINVISLYVDILNNVDSSEKEDEASFNGFNIAISDGHLGELLGAYYAKLMGVPINRIICASNRNKTVSEFLRSGKYAKRRQGFATNTPSADLLHSLNIERLVFEFLQRNGEETAKLYQKFKSRNEFVLPAQPLKNMQRFIVGGFSEEKAVSQTISQVYDELDICIDPHTALAYNVYKRYEKRANDSSVVVYIASLSPFMCLKTVYEALFASQSKPNHVAKNQEKKQGVKGSWQQAMVKMALEIDKLPPLAFRNLVDDYFKNKEEWYRNSEAKRGKTTADPHAFTDFNKDDSLTGPLSFLYADLRTWVNNRTESKKDEKIPLIKLQDLDNVLSAYLGIRLHNEAKPAEKLQKIGLEAKDRETHDEKLDEEIYAS